MGKEKRDEKVFIRMSPQELREIKENANKYSKGNLSRWLRDRAKEPMLDVSIKMQDEKDSV